MDAVIDLPHEEWRDIAGYTGYQVSNMGRVKSLKRGKAHILKAFENNRGYYRVALSQKGKVKRYLVSRLVAEAFCECGDITYNTVDHIDCDKSNNCASNLRWMSAKENTQTYFREQRRLVKGVKINA